MEKEFDSVVYHARLAVINSQLRINIADIAVHALEQQGFVMDEAGYEQGDGHRPYSVTMHNVENSRVVIHVDPVSDVESTNALIVEIVGFGGSNRARTAPKVDGDLRRADPLWSACRHCWNCSALSRRTTRLQPEPVHWGIARPLWNSAP